MGKERRYFSRDFKLEAVRLAARDGNSVAQVARELGVHENLLYRWSRQLRTESEGVFPGKGRLRPEEEELRRLKRDYERVKEERDILKKALAVFSQGPK